MKKITLYSSINIRSILCATIFISGICVLSGCANDMDDNMRNSDAGRADNAFPLTISATAGSFDVLVEADESSAQPTSTRTTEENYTTKFIPGDAIGIFALRDFATTNVATIDDVYNLKLVYSETDGKGTWAPESGDTHVLYSYNDLTYVAYYPYRTGITIKKDDLAHINADLANQLPPQQDQSTPEKYAFSDLMTASGTPAANPDDPSKMVLKLEFSHQYSLLVLEPKVLVKCVAPDGAGFEYYGGVPTLDTDAKEVTINGIKPLRMTDGTFRAILNNTAEVAVTPNGSYKTKDDRTILYKGTELTAGILTAGKCYTQQVETLFYTDGTIVRELQVGDYFCSDGKILPYETPLQINPSDRIGVVFYIGPGPGDTFTNYADTGISGDIHGYVVALNDAYPSDIDKKWGPRYRYFGVGETTQFNGYTKKAYVTNTHALCQAAAEVRNYRIAVPTPAKASDWYVPSIAQLRAVWDVYKQSEDSPVYRSLQKVGGETFANRLYWTVTERNEHDIHCINMQTGAVSDRNGKCSGNDMGWGYNAYGGIHMTRTILTF